MIKNVIIYLNYWRTFSLYLLVNLVGNEFKQRIDDEAAYWLHCLGGVNRKGKLYDFSYLLIHYKEYRNLINLRFSQNACFLYKFMQRIVMFLFPMEKTLYLCSKNIGWNLFIQHGFSTMVSPHSIGENCHINQQVTIGYSWAEKSPTIGNGVMIFSGAKVLGDITIGDNAIIGANAVVIKNVAEDEIVGGVPAKSIGQNITHRRYPDFIKL